MQLSSARASAPQRLTRPNPIQRARTETGSPPAPAAKAAAALVPDPDDGGITLPEGFRALVVADGLHTKDPDTTGAIRFLAVAPSGDLYVKTSKGGIIALRDTNGDGRADVRET